MDQIAADVQHSRKGRKFFLCQANLEANLRYAIPEEGVIDLQFTYVPPMLREQGIAKSLIRGALEFALANNYKVIPTCRIVAYFIDKHREYQALLRLT